MSDYMPKCATCEHYDSCIVRIHLTEMALILWNINREEERELKQGEWISNSPYTGLCSECGREGNLKNNFCPNCGADMRGADNE